MNHSSPEIEADDALVEPFAEAPLPLLAVWLWESRLGPTAGGRLFGVSGEAVRKYCLPFGDPLRMVPQLPTLQKIFEVTGGVVTPAHFYPWDLFPRRVLHPAPEHLRAAMAEARAA